MLYSYFSPHAKSWSAQVYPGTPTFSLQPNKKGAYRRKAICTFFALLIKLLIICVNILFTLREYVTLDFWVKSIYT